jgi:hypothetical protein
LPCFRRGKKMSVRRQTTGFSAMFWTYVTAHNVGLLLVLFLAPLALVRVYTDRKKAIEMKSDFPEIAIDYCSEVLNFQIAYPLALILLLASIGLPQSPWHSENCNGFGGEPPNLLGQLCRSSGIADRCD